MTETGTDWRLLDGVLTGWFEAPSLAEGATLAGHVVDLSADNLVDLRATGLRVRLASADQAEAVSAYARDLGLTADPSALQQVGVVLDAVDAAAVRGFWQRVLAYAPTDDGGLTDPLRRDPALRIRSSTDPRPLRNRLHLDVGRPAAAVQRADLGSATGPYGVCHADPEGNEVDLVPGGALAETAETADWQALFSAVACYRVSSATQQRELVTAAAGLAAAAGFPLLIDLRPGLVIIDSGKDQWEADAHGLEVDFAQLAGRVQSAAREQGATADPGLPRFVQLFFDAADVAAVRAFWLTALGYTEDRRAGATDIYDPRRLNPVIVFQELDASDAERRRQRNRSHVEVAVPAEVAPARLATIRAAGGTVLDASANRWRVADPDGNELVIVGGA